jgi:hypothetical protein
MRKIIIALMILSSINICASELSKEDKKVIDELLEITGAIKIGEMMSVAVSNEFINAMAQQNKKISPKVVKIVQDEIGKFMSEQFVENGFIYNLSYDIYPKYFTINEIKEMVDFYKTPTGKKVASVMPQLAQESMIAGQRHGQSLIPKLQERLKKRLEAEGVQ